MASHIEVHLVSTRAESVLLAQGGLPPVHLEPIECGVCTRQLAALPGTHAFEPVCLVVGPDRIAYLCTNCLKPLLQVLPGVDPRGDAW